jgi:hypothetical protein
MRVERVSLGAFGAMVAVLASIVLLWPETAAAQPVPKPFPKAGQAASGPPEQPPASPPAQEAGAIPTEATLGLPLYPAAQYLASYDAGRGQRYHLFGTTAAFGEVVAFYRNVLRQKGELVFDQPPTHMFEVGRFREASMAFPPGVTIKDFSWTPAGGYPNPKLGAKPDRFPTVIQIVPAPPVAEEPALR